MSGPPPSLPSAKLLLKLWEEGEGVGWGEDEGDLTAREKAWLFQDFPGDGAGHVHRSPE